MKQELPDINDKSVGDVITIDFGDYFEDLDGDTLTYSADEGDIDGSVWTFTYGGGLVSVTVLAEDGRDGEREEMFVINDTSDPYIAATYFNSAESHTDAIDGADGVRGNSVIHVECNENIVFATAPTEISLIDEDSTSIAFTATITDSILTIDPDTDLVQDGVEYTLSIPDDCIKDLNGNVTTEGYEAMFTTVDRIGPRVTSSDPSTGDNLPVPPTVTLDDPITYQFHEPVRSNYYPVYIGPDEDTWIAWDIDTTIDTQAGTMTSYLKQDTLEDNTVYRLYPNVYDLNGNSCDKDYITFRTGDVTSPDLMLAPYYTGDASVKYMMKVTGSSFVIPYDENIFEGVNFDDIQLEEVMTQNLAMPFISRAAELLGLPSTLVQQAEDLAVVPINVTIQGNNLVVTALTDLIPNCMYSLVIPAHSVGDAGGLSVLETEEVRITKDFSDKPEVYACGFTTDGEIRLGGSTFYNPLENLFIVFNEGVRKTSYNSLDQITLTDSSGGGVRIEPRLITWDDDLYGVDIGQVITIKSLDTLNENETYTLTMPAGTVENILGYDNDLYTKNLTTGDYSIPGIDDETFNIYGDPRVGAKVYAHYVFEEYGGMFESYSSFQWYRGTLFDGSDKVAIPGATHLGYKITGEDYGKYLFFEVTPKLSDGSSLLPSVAIPIGPIGAPFGTNNGLDLLEVKDGGDVVFSEDTNIENEYDILVGSDAKEVSVTALPQDENADVRFYFDGMTEDDMSGTERDVPLSFGENQVSVTITDEKGTGDQTYVLRIERSSENEAQFKPDGYCEIRPDAYYSDNNIHTGDLLNGDTYYYDDEKRDEGESLYQWYRSGGSDGVNLVLIGEGQTYTAKKDDSGYYVFFEYTPVTESGVSGDPYLSEPVIVAESGGPDETVYEVPGSTIEQPEDEDDSAETSGLPSVPDTGGGSGAQAVENEEQRTGSDWIWYVLGGVLLLPAAGASLLILRKRGIIKFKRK